MSSNEKYAERGSVIRRVNLYFQSLFIATKIITTAGTIKYAIKRRSEIVAIKIMKSRRKKLRNEKRLIRRTKKLSPISVFKKAPL